MPKVKCEICGCEFMAKYRSKRFFAINAMLKKTENTNLNIVSNGNR